MNTESIETMHTTAAGPNGEAMLRKADVFLMLLMDCHTWMSDSGGLDELPPLRMHVSGRGNETTELVIPGHAYIMEVPEHDAMAHLQLLEGVYSRPLNISVGSSQSDEHRRRTVCTPGFGAFDYATAANGPVWILGSSLFYEYVVGYDLSSTPPSMFFVPQGESPCGACRALGGSLATHVRRERVQAARRKFPRQVKGAPRIPTLNFNGEM